MFTSNSTQVEQTQTIEVVKTIVPESSDTTVYAYDQVEELPLFCGTASEEEYHIEFLKYLHANFRFPEMTRSFLGGRVFGEFIIEKDGSISNAKVIRGIYPLIDAEVLRVVNTSPKWTPGKVNGEAVRIRQLFVMTFILR